MRGAAKPTHERVGGHALNKAQGQRIMGRLWVAGTLAATVGTGLLAGHPVAAQDPALQRGSEVYEEQRCALCHAIGGKGNLKGPLDDIAGRLTEEQMRLWLVDPDTMAEKTKTRRQPPMPAYSDLSADDLEALITYMLSLARM